METEYKIFDLSGNLIDEPFTLRSRSCLFLLGFWNPDLLYLTLMKNLFFCLLSRDKQLEVLASAEAKYHLGLIYGSSGDYSRSQTAT